MTASSRNRYATLDELPAGRTRRHVKPATRADAARAVSGARIEAVRGNVNTRLAKLDRGDFDALVMAAAGLKRLGFAARIRQVIPTAVSLPAPGQGALGIEVLREDDATHRELLAPLNDPATRAATMAERGVSRGLGGSCQVPLAAYAEIEGRSCGCGRSSAMPPPANSSRPRCPGALDDAERLAARLSRT